MLPLKRDPQNGRNSFGPKGLYSTLSCVNLIGDITNTDFPIGFYLNITWVLCIYQSLMMTRPIQLYFMSPV